MLNKGNSTNRVAACRGLLLYSTILAFSVLPAWAANEEVLRPSQLNSDPQYYDGREVVVRGYSFLGPEQNFLLKSRATGVHNRRKWARGEGGDRTMTNTA